MPNSPEELKSINNERLTEAEAFDEAELMRGQLIKRHVDLKDVTPEQYQWAQDRITKIKELARKETTAEELKKDVIRAIGDVALIPALVLGALEGAVMTLVATFDGAVDLREHGAGVVSDAFDELRDMTRMKGKEGMKEAKQYAKVARKEMTK